MNVAVIGLGYVGAVSSACLAKLGHVVSGIDVDEAKVDEIEAGRSPIVEPELEAIIAESRSNERLRATSSIEEGLRAVDVIVVCVGTPPRSDGTVDLSHVERVSHEIGTVLRDVDRFVSVLFRSTVPPGTVADVLTPALERASHKRAGVDFGVAMAPEFLREGAGVADFFDPPFTVVGVGDERTLKTVADLFAGLDAPLHALPIASAESLKYACNAFHAVKVTFANEIGRILGAIGVDSRDVMDVFRQDDRLNASPAYLRPGFSFGGSCLPKDLRALMHIARERDVDTPMLGGVLRSNEVHSGLAVRRILDTGERDVALLGLSFKDETDDLRESPYVALAEALLGKGVRLRIFDPIVNPERLRGANLRYVEQHLPHLGEMLVSTPEAALADARVAVIATSDESALRALALAKLEHVLDLSGRIGGGIDEQPGYQGIAW